MDKTKIWKTLGKIAIGIVVPSAVLAISYVGVKIYKKEPIIPAFTKEQKEKRAKKILEELKLKLEALMKDKKIWGYGTVYDKEKYGNKVFIQVNTEKITSELEKEIPKQFKGVEIKLNEIQMPKAQ